MTEDQARQLFFDHCQPCGRGALERYGERPAVAAILAALSPEAPAREGAFKAQEIASSAAEAFQRLMVSTRFDREMRELWAGAYNDMVAIYSALTPRHEAPAPRPELAPYTEDLKGIKAAMLADEAPAEGAGEREEIARIVEPSAFVEETTDHSRVYRNLSLQEGRAEAFTKADKIIAVRARSSAPEAREGEAVGVVYSLKADLNTAELPDGTLLYTHPAHPSADHAELTRLAKAAGGEALGNLLAVIHGDGGHRALEVGTKQAALEAEKIVAGLFAAPSADKLRIAVEALSWSEKALERYVDALGLDQTDDAALHALYLCGDALAALKAEGC